MAEPTVTQTFTGTAAGFYISAALQDSVSLDFMTVLENVKYKMNVQTLGAANVVRDATCDFTHHGTLDLGERVLEVEPFQINIDLCKKNLLSSWEALTMRAGAGGAPAPEFTDYVISYMAGNVSSQVEKCIWTGNTANNGEFTGFVTGAVGLLLGAGATQVAASASPFTNANIIANLNVAYESISDALFGKDDLYIYMSPTSYQMYIQASSALTNFPYANMSEDYIPMFNGVKLAVCNGMSNDELVVAQKSNLFFGTDLISDTDGASIKILDMGALDGSDNLRIVTRYNAGVRQGIVADIVRVA